MFTSSLFNLSPTSSLFLITKMLCNLRSFWLLPVCTINLLSLISMPNYHNDLNGHCELLFLFIRCVFDFASSNDKDHIYVGGKDGKNGLLWKAKSFSTITTAAAVFCFAIKNLWGAMRSVFFSVVAHLLMAVAAHTISVIKNYYSNWPRKKW